MKKKRIMSIIMVLIMALGLPIALFAQNSSSPEVEHSNWAYIEDASQLGIDPGTRPDVATYLKAIDGRGLSRISASDVPVAMAFELYRVQLALYMGMELDTFLFGDVNAWADAYLDQWRLSNNVVMTSYDGPMAVSFNPETGAYYAYSMHTFEFIYSRIQSQEELELLQKVTYIRAPYVFFSQADTSEMALSRLMYQTIGIQSVEALLDAIPLALLESYMVGAGLTFADIGENWIYETSSISQVEMSHNNVEPDSTLISEYLPPAVRDMLRSLAQMERDGVRAEDAMQMLAEENAFVRELLDEVALYNHTLIQEQQAFMSSSEIAINPLFDPRHSRVANTTIAPYNAVAHLRVHMPDGAVWYGTGFFASPNGGVLVTAAHVVTTGAVRPVLWSTSAWMLEIAPGRVGSTFPNHLINVFPRVGDVRYSWGWFNLRNHANDWAVVRSRPMGISGLNLSQATTDQDFRARPHTRVVGFPYNAQLRHNRFMYQNTGHAIYNCPQNSRYTMRTTNLSIPGYSGSPVFCDVNWVRGIRVAGSHGNTEGTIVRMRPEIINYTHYLAQWWW